MKLHEYEDFVDVCPLIDDPALGLPGEVGEVLEIVKKDRRLGTKRVPADLAELEKELGDVVWYVTKLAHKYNINIEEIIETNYKKLSERHKDEIVSHRKSS